MIAAAGLEPVRPAGLHPHRTGKPCGELLSTCKGVEFQAGYSFEYSIFFFFFLIPISSFKNGPLNIITV